MNTKTVEDVLNLEMRVYDYKIEMLDVPEKDNPESVKKVETLTLLASVGNNPQFEVKSTSQVLIRHIDGMDFSDGVGKRTVIRSGVSKLGRKFYYFERNL